LFLKELWLNILELIVSTCHFWNSNSQLYMCVCRATREWLMAVNR